METLENVSNFVIKEKNFDNDDDDDDDDKENVAVKRIPDEPKVSCGNREVNKIFPQQQQRTRTNRSPRLKSTGTPTLLYIDGNGLADAAAVKRRIPRPANAFMLFANEWRKKFAAENPRESNKDISVRLGIFWKSMSKDVKEKYFALAREVDREHKRKYPVNFSDDDDVNDEDDGNDDDDEEEVDVG
ncbi:hypothetical protein P5V15_006538 [Pogonomyrmex californicus]